MTLHNKVLSTILGGAVGDALGVPVEFKKRNSFRITTMTGYGTYNQPKGTWSDDTSLTMCLIDNLIDKQDEYDLMQKFANYWSDGYWTPYGEMFDILASQQAKRFAAIKADFLKKSGEEALNTTTETERLCVLHRLRLHYVTNRALQKEKKK